MVKEKIGKFQVCNNKTSLTIKFVKKQKCVIMSSDLSNRQVEKALFI